ncbi:glycoside hydrolase family 27 protein [Maribellus maritimus]|uniref:glycoside hydrolase family 27 protein n=1 Tax=Maribellus maritimus TaxID=2870838 RepID=UPI001EECA701|nr:glycoside hydrolase family 27 protein [Maribellus maritimus]MCG6187888.1 glycoside hydrolase family 27 protein [Maribellus maritimus]
MKLKRLISAAVSFLVMLHPLLAQNKTPEFYSLAESPPMGWNSWDCYGPTVTEKEVKANTDYMAEKLKSFGWQYIVVDIRWYVENTKAQGYNQTDPVYCMDEYGRLIPATNKFPSSAENNGFKPLADYIHKKGLKFGIHLMRGIPVEAVKRNTPVKGTKHSAKDIYSEELQCKWLRDMYTVDASKPGAQEYYNSLFELYASWEVDYVKIDNLSRPYHQKEIELIRNAIDNCGRPMVLSTSPGATPLENAEHVKRHANLWRICDDFWDNWRYMAPMFELCKHWAPYSGPGHWPDADMLPLGRISIRGERGEERMTGFTTDEQFTLINLWAIFRSPLMFGGDLPSNDDFTLSLITNKDILKVNQSSSNNRELKNENGLIVWTADIPNSKDRYVAFFNSNDKESEAISVKMKELDLNDNAIATDLWSKEKETVKNGKFTKKIAPHASAIFRLSQNL